MVKVAGRSVEEFSMEMTMRLSGTLLKMEGAIQKATSALARCITEETLPRFGTDGSPIRAGKIKLTARERDPKEYQTPYGAVQVERYVYQSSRGGRIYCPREHQARITSGAAPRFASQFSHKYAQLNVLAVQVDLEQNHGRKAATSYIQNVAEWVGTIASAKEDDWVYALPVPDGPIATVAVSLDAMIPLVDSGNYREAMVTTLSFSDHAGERWHTPYLAAAPEVGRHAFLERLEREFLRASGHFSGGRLFATSGRAPAGRLAARTLPQAQTRPRCPQRAHRQGGTPLASRGPLRERARWRLQRLDRLQQSSPPDAPSCVHRRAPADRFGADRDGLHDPGQATPVRLRHALEDQRRRDRAQPLAPTHTVSPWTQFWQKIDQFGAECCV